jgi:hypothetical protein
MKLKDIQFSFNFMNFRQYAKNTNYHRDNNDITFAAGGNVWREYKDTTRNNHLFNIQRYDLTEEEIKVLKDLKVI